MATTIVTPAAPVASSTPSTPAISTPTPVSTPEVSTPVAVETPVSAPVTTPAVSVKAEPKQTDFPGDIEGFLKARGDWEREQPDAPEIVEEAPVEQPAVIEEAATEEVKPEEQVVEEEKPWAPEPEAALTPEALNGLIEKSPELKAAMDASPDVKNALFSMARINAKAAPMLEIFPNVESAQFAAESSNKFVVCEQDSCRQSTIQSLSRMPFISLPLSSCRQTKMASLYLTRKAIQYSMKTFTCSTTTSSTPTTM